MDNNIIQLKDMQITKKYTVVSLFSGAGGLDMGFEFQGFNTIWANDIDEDACETHRGWSAANVSRSEEN